MKDGEGGKEGRTRRMEEGTRRVEIREGIASEEYIEELE